MSRLQRILQLFRSLFPYWKFFDRLGVVPRAFYRFDDNEKTTEWIPLHPKQKRQLKDLFHNAKVNQILWEQSQLSIFLEECQKLNKSQIMNHEMYRWLQERVELEIQHQSWSWFQFRICLFSYEENKLKEELWLESESIERVQQ